MLTIDSSVRICPNPVFIFGSPRSGTTVLAWALAQHSHFWTSGESYFLHEQFARKLNAKETYARAASLSTEGWLQRENVTETEYLAFLGIGVNALFTNRSRDKRWVDHTPHYALMAGILAEMFPGAKFIHILRDGRKVVNSMQAFQNRVVRKQMASDIKDMFVPSWASDFRNACQTWRDYVEASMDFAARMPEQCLTINLDLLSADSQDGFAKITRFLGEHPEEKVATYYENNRLNSSFGPGGAPNNPWQAWSLEQRLIFLGEAGATMLKYNLAAADELWLSDDSNCVALIQSVVAANLPRESSIAVIAKGNDDLLNLYGRRSCHFPCDEEGNYVWYHPVDSHEASRNLETARARGVNYLLIPKNSFWWLEHYSGFREYLEFRYRCTWSDANCRIYTLSDPQGCSSAEIPCAALESRNDVPLIQSG